jgi:membrane-bound serine protease (ClpP class)
MEKLNILFLILFFNFPISLSFAQVHQEKSSGSSVKILVYKFDIKKTIAEPVWRTTKQSFTEAEQSGADYVLIHMNTYGGTLDAADSIRTVILNSEIPVFVFIDNNAASAGALISIACDSIYMRKGASIGAATVVNASGSVVAEKYQSFMRSTMRATAEAHGKDTIIKGTDTLLVWHRDPRIAEAMVDPRVYLEGITDTGQLLTFTTNEAIKYGFCEGEAESVEEVMEITGIENYEIKEYVLKPLESFIQFLVNPIIQGILIMIIIGGIYFELQTPGVGFPLGAAIFAAIFYFAPLYLEGLAENWELVLFIAGLILIGIEIFAIPGFGVAGVTGITLMVAGLTLSMVDNIVFQFDILSGVSAVLKALFIVVVSALLSFLFSLYISKKIFTTRHFRFALDTVQETDKGFVGVDSSIQKEMIGKTGVATTILRPSGKVEINGEIFDAVSEVGYINKGEEIKVVRDLAGQIYVIKNQ